MGLTTWWQPAKEHDQMNKKEFLNAVSNGKEDIIQIFLDALAKLKANYCVIGGLAVNA